MCVAPEANACLKKPGSQVLRRAARDPIDLGALRHVLEQRLGNGRVEHNLLGAPLGNLEQKRMK